MNAANGPYLVTRMQEGFGEVYPLKAGQRFTLGRANTNRIVLKDELCSREHAEVFFADGQWRLRDLESLNGTRHNGAAVEGEGELASGDAFQVGKTQFLFVKSLEDLPQAPPRPAESEGVAIKKRLGQTRFLTPQPEELTSETPLPGTGRHSLSRDLSLLYRLALDMGSAASEEELTRIVLDGLLEAVPAEAGAVLSLLDGRNFEILSQRHRDPSEHDYVPLPDGVVKEVLDVKEAILAEDAARDRYLRGEPSVRIGATSLICAPVLFSGNVLNLIHLYCTDPLKSLNAEDLEFTVAVAKQLGGVIHQLQRQENLSAQNQSLRDQLKVESELVGKSPAIRKIEEQIGLVAGTNATVLIRGESGSGKELVARAIHYSSLRRDAPFICLNCAALSETLLESELFGHEKGAFTGATDKKIGKFEAADGGSIFLDEIGEMAPGTQAKLLRVLEGHPYERVGGHVPIRVDVRVVAATNQPLEKNLQEGTFRRDLFFRLQVVEIRVPPLRERLSDVAMLADHFLKRFVAETGRKIRGFTASAMRKLEHHVWPGNVRELRNVIERAVALGRTSSIDAGDIWLTSVEVASDQPRSTEPVFKPLPLEDIERRHIEQTLDYANWNKTQAAALLEIERSTLDRKIRLYELKKAGE